jgi:hypothetical protein
MDFKSLLQTMDNISETVHKAGPGGYGNRHGSETQTDQYGKPIGKVSLASLAPKDDKPKSRGRPVDPDKPKTGKDDPKNQKVGDLFGRTTGDVPKGKKGSQHTPMKDADKEEKKAEKKSLKDWIEVSEHNQLNEEDVSVKPIQASQIIGADGKSMGTADPATANAIKAAAEKGTLNLSGDDSSSSSSSTSSTSSQPMTEKSDKPVKTDASAEGKYKGKSKSELLKAFKHLKKTGPHEKDSTQYKNMKELAVAIRAKGDSGKEKEEPVSEGGYNPDRDAEKEWDRYAQGDRDFQNRERNAGEEPDTPRYPRTSDRMRQAQQRHYGFKRPRSESISEADDDFEQEDEAYIACIVQHNRSGQAVVQRTKPISRDRAEEVIKHALSKNTFVHPPFMTIYPANAGKLDGSTIMAQFPDMSQEAGSVNTGMMEGKEKIKAKDLPGDQDELDVKKPFGELTDADFKALSKKKKVKEDRTMQILEGINFKELMASADSEVQEMLIELQDDVEMFKKTGHTSELIDSFLKVHLHHSKKRITDEAAGAGRGSVNPPAVNPSAPLPPARSAAPGWGRDDYKPLVPFDTSPKSSMGTIKGGVWTADPPKRGERGVPIPMDLEAVPEGNFLSTLGQSNKTFESKIMKDIQLESWEKELNSLLTVNEGITVSTSTGQQGSPDSVSVNATDGDSAELLQVLRQAGLGVFGGEEERSSYGSPMHSQEPTGAGSEPEMSPAVVGDGNDMMALLKKMSGIQDGGEPEGVAVVDVSSEEDEDENSHYGSDNHDHEEENEVDEGSEWTEKLKNTPKGGKFTIGGKEYTDTSSLEEEDRLISKANSNDGTISTSSSTGRIQATMGPNGISVSPKPSVQNGQDSNKKAQKQDESHDHEDHETCNECGMYEARCVCEPGQEQVEEAAKYRDPKYKDKLYTVEPLDYTYGPDADELYYNPKPDDYEGRKRKIGGSEFSHNDPLRKGYGRGGASNSINTHGKRKGMPSRDQISSLKGSIKDGHGTHPRPNLPEEQVEEDYANEAGHEEMASLKHLLNAGNDMHYPKEKQSVGNPTKVTFETKLLKDSTSLLQDFRKLSGIK